MTYRSSLHQASKVAVEVWRENIQVKRVNECFQIVSHFLNSEKMIMIILHIFLGHKPTLWHFHAKETLYLDLFLLAGLVPLVTAHGA